MKFPKFRHGLPKNLYLKKGTAYKAVYTSNRDLIFHIFIVFKLFLQYQTTTEFSFIHVGVNSVPTSLHFVVYV